MIMKVTSTKKGHIAIILMVDLLITNTFKKKFARTNTFCYNTVLWNNFLLWQGSLFQIVAPSTLWAK